MGTFQQQTTASSSILPAKPANPSTISGNRKQVPLASITQQSVPSNALQPPKTNDPISNSRDEYQSPLKSTLKCSPSFHVANIQSLITKTVTGKKIPFLKNQEKI